MRIIFYFFIFLILVNPNLLKAQDNGYRLEFQTVVTLSTDSTALPSIGNDVISSYTVPTGCTLKITSGQLTSVGIWVSASANWQYLYQTVLNIGNNKILCEDWSATAVNQILRPFIINSDNPIWVPEGKTITITTKRGTLPATSLTLSPGIRNCWISAVVFKLVAN